MQRKINWLVGLTAFAVVLLSNFTGYLLPWDQLAYWAVTICASMLTYFPGIGGWLHDMIIGGKELGPQTLSIFFALHTALFPAVLILLLPFHFWRIRKAGGLAARPDHGANPAVKEDRIEVVPHLMVREMATAMAVLAVVLIMAALWDAPLGAKANPGLSPNPTKAPWYFAGLQELLLHLPPRLAVTMIPLMAVILALVRGSMHSTTKDHSAPGSAPHQTQTARRTFLTRLWAGLGLLALAELAAVGVTFLRRGTVPRASRKGDLTVTCGPAHNFQPGTVTAFVRGRFYLARLDDGGFMALSRQCTHLGCTVPWVEEEKRFACSATGPPSTTPKPTTFTNNPVNPAIPSGPKRARYCLRWAAGPNASSAICRAAFTWASTTGRTTAFESPGPI